MSQVAGVLVHAHPQSIEPVSRALSALPGVEVHGASAEGRLVVTVEDDGERGLADTFVRFQDIGGVLSAAVIYHHIDDQDAQGTPSNQTLTENPAIDMTALDEQEAAS